MFITFEFDLLNSEAPGAFWLKRTSVRASGSRPGLRNFCRVCVPRKYVRIPLFCRKNRISLGCCIRGFWIWRAVGSAGKAGGFALRDFESNRGRLNQSRLFH